MWSVRYDFKKTQHIYIKILLFSTKHDFIAYTYLNGIVWSEYDQFM